MYEKPVHHTLSKSLRSIGLALYRGNCQSVAHAVMKCTDTSSLVISLVLEKLMVECEILCSSSSQSTLRMTSPENLQAFDWSAIADELKQKAPLLFAVLMAVGAPPRPRNIRKGVTEESRYPGVCTAAAILLKERCDNMSALQHLVGIILFHGNASKQVISKTICFSKTCHFMLYFSTLDTKTSSSSSNECFYHLHTCQDGRISSKSRCTCFGLEEDY